MRYELFYLVGVSKELDLEKIKNEIDEIVTSHAGVFEEKTTQEKRKMAYKIKKDTHGIYIAKRFSIDEPENIPEIINKLNLHPGVLRFIVSTTEDLPELKTKDERIEQEEKRGEMEKICREKKEAFELEKNQPKKAVETDAPKTEAEKNQETESSEAIDKKLEELLNI
jgi:ribosomal protein S6